MICSFLMALPTSTGTNKESREREAKRACLNGEVDVGVKILTDLYVDTNDATYIFNQGRCFEQSSHFEQAISRFREYLRKARKTTEEDRADVQKHIADCESLMHKAREKTDQDQAEVKGESARPLAPAPALPPQPSPPVTPPSASTVFAQQPPASGTRSEGSALRTGGLLLASAGGAALIAGVAFNLKYNSMTSDLKSNYYENTASTSHTYKLLSQIGYGAGAAGVGVGALLYYLGWRAGRVALAPTVMPDHAGVVLSGAF